LALTGHLTVGRVLKMKEFMVKIIDIFLGLLVANEPGVPPEER